MKTVIILLTTLLSACASSRTQTMSYNDLNYFKVDCDRSLEQMTFLKAQLRNAEFQQDRAVIYYNMNQIARWCPAPAPRPQGCLHVREDFNSGSGLATVCRENGKEAPVVSRWETEIDN
jgi:hypothetical protein